MSASPDQVLYDKTVDLITEMQLEEETAVATLTTLILDLADGNEETLFQVVGEIGKELGVK